MRAGPAPCCVLVTRIDGILSGPGRADVQSESKASLDQIAAFLQAEPGVKLQGVGHTDSVGNFDSYMALSKRRKEASRGGGGGSVGA
jgi:OOP family OmpA-OmpF porin